MWIGGRTSDPRLRNNNWDRQFKIEMEQWKSVYGVKDKSANLNEKEKAGEDCWRGEPEPPELNRDRNG